MKISSSTPATTDLPASLAEAQALLAQLQQQLLQRDQHIHLLELKNQKLTHELASLKRLRFGRKAESLPIEQRSLFEDDLDQDLAAISAELEPALPETTPRKSRPRAGRQPLPDHLERVEIRHEPERCTCGQCQSRLTQIGEDVSEQLDIEPSRFFFVRHIRPQYACRQCETITAAPVSPAVIDRKSTRLNSSHITIS